MIGRPEYPAAWLVKPEIPEEILYFSRIP